MITLKKVEDKLSDRYDELSNGLNSMQAVFNGPIFKMYIKAQAKRWASENASEGSAWPALNAEYAKRKIKRFGRFPGGGTKMMVATGTLYNAATNQGKGLNKKAENNKLTIAIDDGQIEYAKYAAERRAIMEFGDDTISKMKAVIRKYITQGVT